MDGALGGFAKNAGERWMPANYDPFEDPYMAKWWICLDCESKLKIDKLKEHMRKTGHMEMLRDTYPEHVYPEFHDIEWNEKSEQRKAWETTVKKISMNLDYIAADQYHNNFSEWIQSKDGRIPDFIIVGAGPSLTINHHLEMLAKSHFNGTIILTDRTLVAALKAGITPDKFDVFVNTLDDKQEILERFYMHDIVKKWIGRLKFLCAININHNLTQFLDIHDAKIFWYHPMRDWKNGEISFDRIYRMMLSAKGCPPIPLISDGGNVGTCSWMLAHLVFGAKRVILTGMDLTIRGDRKYELEESDNIKKQESQFSYYRHAFYHALKHYSDSVETINCTQGGALSGPDLKSIKLEDYLNDSKPKGGQKKEIAQEAENREPENKLRDSEREKEII